MTPSRPFKEDRLASFHASLLLQAISGVMPLALCPQMALLPAISRAELSTSAASVESPAVVRVPSVGVSVAIARSSAGLTGSASLTPGEFQILVRRDISLPRGSYVFSWPGPENRGATRLP